MYQNVTLKLDQRLLRRAKIVATQEGTSLTQLMVRALQGLLGISSEYTRAKKHALAALKKGWRLGGGPYYRARADLHTRHGR